MQQAADGVDQTKRSLSPNRIFARHTSSTIFIGNQLRQELRRWLSPSDPSTNHNIACNAHHKGTATWFFEGRTYEEWKSTGPDSTGSDSLLWIHGKRLSLSHSASWHLLMSPTCSWLRQKHTLVRSAFTVFINDN